VQPHEFFGDRKSYTTALVHDISVRFTLEETVKNVLQLGCRHAFTRVGQAYYQFFPAGFLANIQQNLSGAAGKLKSVAQKIEQRAAFYRLYPNQDHKKRKEGTGILLL